MPGSLGSLLREFSRNPLRTGAVVPSSRWLAQKMVAPVAENGDPVVVELGPGTGAITRAIDDRLGGRGHHLAVEINPRLAEELRRSHPGLDVAAADAATLPDLLAERGLNHADVVISSLPWATFPASLQRRLLGAITESLSANGALTTYAYVHALRFPPGMRFRTELDTNFEEVILSGAEWRNVPPASVYYARRPRHVPMTNPGALQTAEAARGRPDPW